MAQDSIIELLESKEALYLELLAIFEEESLSLGSIELSDLWAFTEEKSKLSMEIETLRESIVNLAFTRLNIDPASTAMHLRDLSRLFPEEEPRIIRSVETIIFIKGKIKKLASTSAAFVEEYLSTVEEVIQMLTTSSPKSSVYGVNRYLMETSGSVLIRGEA